MKKLFPTRSKGDEKPSKGPPVAKKPVRTAGKVESKKIGGTGFETKKSKGSAEFVPIPRPKNSVGGNSRKCPGSGEQLQEIGPPIPLSRVKEYHSLPCLVKFCQGYTSLCESHSFGTDQFFVVLEQKKIDAAVMRDCEQEFVIPISTNSFRVVPSLPDFPERTFDARELLEYQSLPPVVQVTKEFRTDSSNIGTVLAGTRLFSLYFLYNMGRNEESVKVLDRLAGEMEDGTRIEILADCAGEFSVNKHDIQLELATAVSHIKVPFSCKLIPLDDDIYNISVLVERVERMDALCGVMTIDDNINLEDEVYSFQRRSEVPTSVDVMVVAMAPTKPKVIESVYATAMSFYELVPWPSVREEISGELKSCSSDAVYANVPSVPRSLSVSITKSPVYGHSGSSSDGSKRPPARSYSHSSTLLYNHHDSPSDERKRSQTQSYSHSSNSPYNHRDSPSDESKRPPARSYSHSSISPYNHRDSSTDERKRSQTQSYSHLSNSPYNRRDSSADERKHSQTRSYSHSSSLPYNRHASSVEIKQPPAQSYSLSSSLPYNYGDSHLDDSKQPPTRSYSISSYPAYENHDPLLNGSPRSSGQGSRVSNTRPSSHVYGNFDSLRNESTQEEQQSDLSDSTMNEIYDTHVNISRQQSPPPDVSISLCPVYGHNNPYLDVGKHTAKSSGEDFEDRPVYEYVSLKPRYSLGQDSKLLDKFNSLSSSPTKGMYSNFARTSHGEIQKINSPPEIPTNVDPQTNIEYLHTLSTSDVSKLLDVMNLSQYRDIFQREHINGMLMSELDTDMLVELGIQNKLHRLRLIRISTGRDSVQGLLDKHCSHY